MYSSYKVARENDEWENDPRSSFWEGKEANWSPSGTGHASSSSINSDFENWTRNTSGCDVQRSHHMTSSQRKSECNPSKSPISSCNTDFEYVSNYCTADGSFQPRTVRENKENEWYDFSFVDDVTLGSISNTHQKEERLFSSNNLPEEDRSRFHNSGSDRTKTTGPGLGLKNKVDRNDIKRTSQKNGDELKESRKPNNCVKENLSKGSAKSTKKNCEHDAKTDGNLGEKRSETLRDCDTDGTGRANADGCKETSKDDDINNKRKDRLKNLRKEPKRTQRGRKRHVHKKPPNVRDIENVEGDPDGVWARALLLAGILKEGLFTILAVFPVCLRAGCSILWYLIIIGLLSICLLIYWLGMVLKWFFSTILNKARALRADFDEFCKKRSGDESRLSEEQQQEAVGGRRSDANQPRYRGQDMEEGEIVSKLLASKHLDAYGILGVSEDATDDEIKRKYREMAKIVHPDKNSHENSAEAFQILQSAFESISDQEKRMAYRFESDKKKFEEEFEDFLDRMNKHVDELKKKIVCSNCNKTHPRLLTDRLVNAARYCSHCDVRHAAKEGDVWVETSHMGFKYYCYLCMDNQVFEVTEWGACQGLLNSRPNTHGVYLSVKPNRPSWSPWDDLFGDSELPTQPNRNKKKHHKSKHRANSKSKRR